MNESECENLIKSVKWTEPANLISLAILEFINVLVIGGNCLVIAAVFCSNKLRSVTNFFIVNLAVADLLVGLAVLPFSATWEVFKVWIFGDVWCRIWLAVDVWMCTASILNLCAISLDRYVAVTRPVTYPSIMSTKKAKSLIAGIWVLSFVICFPPLVGWKDQKQPMVQPTYTRGNYTLYYATTTTTTTATRPSSAAHSRQQQQQQQFNIPSSPSSPAATSASSTSTTASFNPYNPYDPSFGPLEDENFVSAATTLHPKPQPSGAPSNPPVTVHAESDYDFDSVSGSGGNGVDAGGDAAATTAYQTPPPCPWKCELTNDRGYVLYSALGSFYIPMFVMLFFYWRIYRAAVRTTRAINQGFKTTKGNPHESGGGSSGGGGSGSRVDESRLILRIHRGRPCSTPQRTPLSVHSVHSMSSTLSVNSNGEEAYPLQHSTAAQAHTGTPKRATSMRLHRQRHEKVAIKVSFPSSESVLNSANGSSATLPTSLPTYGVVASSSVGSHKSALSNGRRASFKSSLFEIGETTFNLDTSQAINTPGGGDCAGTSAGSAGGGSGNGNGNGNGNGSGISSALGGSPRDVATATPAGKEKKRSGRRSVKFQVKRFRMETKAAKTLAIIVGGFICCWLPFFTMYLIRAFCEQCIQPTVFSVLFWLGYCNSAINPLIYALFSHEFRIAFKRIICRCVCTRSGFRASENFQMIAARALMAPATFHKTISGCSDDGDGVDFS